MELNADFSKRAVVHSEAVEWVPSPMPGVDRRMLDRMGDEIARATSIVRYAPKSSFSAHTHDGGEEFFVLDGVFQDEHGDFPAGTYVRNPPQSSHTPGSEAGCTIFVKLWQFNPQDRTHIRIDTNKMRFVLDPERAGVGVIPLFHDEAEDVVLERWVGGATVELDASGGFEALVIQGGFEQDGETFKRGSWLRIPKGHRLKAIAGDEGARVWIKRNHLKESPKPPSKN